MNPPSKAQLDRVERELKHLPQGTQRKVGGEVYMRLDKDKRRRFCYRGYKGLPGGTTDTWQEAYDSRRQLKRVPVAGAPESLTHAEARHLPFKTYAVDVYWPDARNYLEDLTQLDYRGILFRDVLPVMGHYTLAQLEEHPILINSIIQEVNERKRYPHGQPRHGQIPKAARDNVIKVARAVLTHAVQKHILFRNPFQGVKRIYGVRRPGSPGLGSTCPVLESEVLGGTAQIVESGPGFRGPWEHLLQRRIIPLLIAIGMRPEDILGNPWSSYRNADGPLPIILVRHAVKDIAGHLRLGEPKTGPRDMYQYLIIAELLDWLYNVQGRPSLDKLAFPNLDGGLQDWGNWRQDVWYPALQRAGVTSGTGASEPGAYVPYALRHIGVKLMQHAIPPDGRKVLYSPAEVAKQFGHSVETMHRVYGGIPHDVLKVGGRTVDDILRQALRDVWGPLPFEPDHTPVYLSTAEAAELSGKTTKQIGGRLKRGTLPGVKQGAYYQVTLFDLAWTGLIPPLGRRSATPKKPG